MARIFPLQVMLAARDNFARGFEFAVGGGDLARGSVFGARLRGWKEGRAYFFLRGALDFFDEVVELRGHGTGCIDGGFASFGCGLETGAGPGEGGRARDGDWTGEDHEAQSPTGCEGGRHVNEFEDVDGFEVAMLSEGYVEGGREEEEEEEEEDRRSRVDTGNLHAESLLRPDDGTSRYM